MGRRVRLKLKVPRILDFDTECRPLSYLGQDFTTSEITAIAWSFSPFSPVTCMLLGRDDPMDMLGLFAAAYDLADIVTGHYIRAFDLPKLNGAMAEYGLPLLGPKMTIDTKNDLKPINGISKSQESLGALFQTTAPKIQMNQVKWRSANRLENIALAEERVIGDVRQHQELRLELTKRGMLEGPKVWSPDV
jgi:hypothetical protein